jgi:hypothetical protein
MRARRTALLKLSGPYEVKSLANGELRVSPAWSQFRPYTEADGGGPGMSSRLALAADVQDFLNGTKAEP